MQIRYLVELKFCTSGSKMTMNLREKPRILSSWILFRMQDFGWYRCQVSCSGDTRMEPVKSGPAELNVTPHPGKSENYCFVCLVFFLLYMKHQSMSH